MEDSECFVQVGGISPNNEHSLSSRGAGVLTIITTYRHLYDVSGDSA